MGVGSFFLPCGSHKGLAISTFGGYVLSPSRPGAFKLLRLALSLASGASVGMPAEIYICVCFHYYTE